MDAERVSRSVAFATDPSYEGVPEDLYTHLRRTFSATEPYGDLIGPVRPRGAPTGLIIRNGYIVAEWGEPDRVDMTFSVTKSFLTAVAGIAFDQGLIRDIDDPVGSYVHDGDFDSPHNSRITWTHFLQHASEWEGTLWGIPHWSDRWEANGRAMGELEPPGTRRDYNDVRVNRLALSLLQVLRDPLPKVLREHVMDPIGASRTWEWHGYENSWVTIEGRQLQSVTGGGHWGGGMWISAFDLARFGYLTLHMGRWADQQVLSNEWLSRATTPSPLAERSGFMNFGLNTGRRSVPRASERAFWHSGHGINRIFVDPELELVVVVRWLDGAHFGDFIDGVISAIQETP